jgi:hypothetical protein
MHKYSIFLDDERIPSDVTWIILDKIEWTIIRNYYDFVKIIEKNGLPEIISFDHDLGPVAFQKALGISIRPSNKIKEEEKTGYDCAKWIINYCDRNNLQLPKYTVHSMNFIGKQNIITLLERYKEWKQITLK